MIPMTWKAGLGMALALSLAACDLTSLKQADDDTQQPATEATVMGVWRTNIPVTTTTPPSDIKVTMEVDADHTMLLSQRVATGQPSPYDFVEISKEYWSWSVADGKMTSVKTTCEYKDPATMQPTGETECREPKTETRDINVKGKAWTVVEDGQPIIFRKD
jgi:hypothetical protein